MPWISAVLTLRRLAEPHFVEGRDRGVVQNAHRRDDGRDGDELMWSIRERCNRVAGIEVGKSGVVAATQHTAPEMAPLGHEVDPGNAVSHVVVAVAHRRQQRVEVGDARRVDSHATGLDRDQPYGRVEHDTCQAHSADRRPEQRCVQIGADHDVVEPSASIIVIDTMCLPMEPSTWWFLPWMSLAMAPPMVTNLVPGVTGTKKPRGTMTCSSSSMLTPAPTVAHPAAGSRTMSPAPAASRTTRPPPFCAASP